MSTTLMPGMRKGVIQAPVSKSHAHRLLIADFLVKVQGMLEGDHDPHHSGWGCTEKLYADEASDSADIQATKRCLNSLFDALCTSHHAPTLDCGESGSTLRFLMPVAAALGFQPVYKKAGRLASRPVIEYPTLEAGVHELPGNVSSQYVTGLLFALPILKGNSEIRFSSPLESRGYVDMTLQVVRDFGVQVYESCDGTFMVPGGQRFKTPVACGGNEAEASSTLSQPCCVKPEGDWSGAAFWFAMDALGSDVVVEGLNSESAQPDRAVTRLIGEICSQGGGVRRGAPPTGQEAGATVDVSNCPDIFPVLAVVAAAQKGVTVFTGTRRLKLKESDRTAAMADVLARFGAKTEMSENSFTVHGIGEPFKANSFTAYGDHRIAMSVAVGATIADGPCEIDNIACAAKSYPGFFELFDKCRT